MRGLEPKALACAVKARLFTHLPFFVPTLDVAFDGEAVWVRGVVRLPRERTPVMVEAGKAAGKAPVRFELRYRR